MKNPRQNFERFCYRHRSKGIPNLMLYIALGSAIVNVLSFIDGSNTLYYLLCFHRASILQGQIWRLITFPLTFHASNILITAIALFCYYSLGRAIENIWGTLRFNLFYFTGILLMDIYCMLLGGQADSSYLNMSLFLAYATLFPNAQFLFLYIIPVKAWIFALIDLALVAFGLLAYPFPYNIFPVIALANYFLFFGKDVLNVIPLSWRIKGSKLFRKKPPKRTGTIPFPNAGAYKATGTTPKAVYTHKCSVCGRTDVSHPDLEFRYCSRCNGYYCYCSEHINNHTHIQ